MARTQLRTNMEDLSFSGRVKADFKRNWGLYLMILPVIAFYVLFMYKPMYGAVIAFQDYRPALGIANSPWIGFEHFTSLFKSPDFPIILRNTIIIGISSLIFSFPAAIILALLFNELKIKWFKSAAQTISYLPHFISLVVVCGMVKSFVSRGGVVLQLVTALGGPKSSLLNFPEYFLPIYILSDIWQAVGWSSIIYLAALSGIDQELYEAARIDGAGKWKQTLHVTIPGIFPTIIIMFILSMGSIFNVGYEKIILLYNPNIYETSDVINSYTFRVGISKQSWSYSTAVGLLNSVVNFVIVIATNKFCSKLTETSLW